MFCVKEYDKEGKYIGYTPFLDDEDSDYMSGNEKAINLAKSIAKLNFGKVIVTELDYNDQGELWERIVWEQIND